MGHGKELADRGMGLAVAERAGSSVGVPIRLFPASYLVDEAYYSLLNTIARTHPETFDRFKPWTPQLGSMLLRNLHDLVMPWAQLHFGEFTLAMETTMLTE